MKCMFDPINIVNHRSELMGFAILWIFLLHSGGCDILIYDTIVSYGWMGVDIFFFLSALGLSYSLNKCKNVGTFYMRRIVRILPTWLLVLFLVHVLGIIILHLLPDVPFNYPHSISQSLLWYTGLGYWLNGILDNPLCCYYEWYIPTLFIFYLISPFLYGRKASTLCILLFISLLFSILLSEYEILYSLRLTHQRIPVFILGFIFYKVLKSNNRSLFLKFIILMTLLGIISMLFLNYKDYIIKYIPLFFVIQFLLLILCVVKRLKISYAFSFLGIISFELYLIHLYKRPNYLISLLFNVNGIYGIILSFFLCIIIAYLLHFFCDKINNGIKTYINRNKCLISNYG